MKNMWCMLKPFIKLLLLSNLILSSYHECFSSRHARAQNFLDKYFDLQVKMAPHLALNWPHLYNKADDIILLWNYTKILLAFITIMSRKGHSATLLQVLLVTEMWVNIVGGCECVCYFMTNLLLASFLQLIAST